ncbi:hypothetical protein DRN74_06595 [Candidatus Micrarchaeota archaeon]|nr:MAG: hypothetical protein DRN74_06595 [Candidatus Micrarchaeota archaeon]
MAAISGLDAILRWAPPLRHRNSASALIAVSPAIECHGPWISKAKAKGKGGAGVKIKSRRKTKGKARRPNGLRIVVARRLRTKKEDVRDVTGSNNLSKFQERQRQCPRVPGAEPSAAGAE